MRHRFPAISTLFATGMLLLFLAGCGLKYAPPATLEDMETERRTAIETEYTNSYKTRNKVYKPLTYGELVVVKPDSYRRLDSLYARKYALQQVHSPTDATDEQIEVQRAVVFNDTNPVLYVETHWFELRQDTAYEYVVDRIALNRNNKIVSVTQLDYFTCPKELVVFARKYMLEESFSTFALDVTDQEIEFYTTYKEKAATLSGSAHQAFTEHTLRVMQLANKISSLSTETILKTFVAAEIKKRDPEADLSAMTYKVERIMEDRDQGNDSFLYYQVTAEGAGSAKGPFVFRYDYYLQAIP